MITVRIASPKCIVLSVRSHSVHSVHTTFCGERVHHGRLHQFSLGNCHQGISLIHRFCFLCSSKCIVEIAQCLVIELCAGLVVSFRHFGLLCLGFALTACRCACIAFGRCAAAYAYTLIRRIRTSAAGISTGNQACSHTHNK